MENNESKVYNLNDPKLKLIQAYFIPDILFLEF